MTQQLDDACLHVRQSARIYFKLHPTPDEPETRKTADLAEEIREHTTNFITTDGIGCQECHKYVEELRERKYGPQDMTVQRQHQSPKGLSTV